MSTRPDAQKELEADRLAEIAPQNLLELAIRKQLKTFTLEVDLKLEAGQGQVLVLFGQSGSGKTMTLRCIAGVTNPDAGLIAVGNRVVFDSRTGINIKLPERRVGYLPQNYGLFPHLNVGQNISFGLFNWEKRRAENRVHDLLKLMQLEGLQRRNPRELSGGQQQRVAFARALAPEPDILLLDEPFSALDAAIRAELRQNLAILSRELGLPVVFITHDLEEAYMLADRIAVYNQGQILQYSSREEVFYRPATKEVARLVGIRNLWEGRVLSLDEPAHRLLVRTGFGELWAQLPSNYKLPAAGEVVTVCLRPEQVSLTSSPEEVTALESGTLNRFSGRIVNEVARGSLYTLFFRPNAGAEASQNSGYQDRTNLPSLYDLELEVTAQHYTDLKRADSSNWQVIINPSVLHVIRS